MAKPTVRAAQSKSDPLWYKRALIYEVPVRAFFDSNGDGIGDFRGLIQKLDYVQDLGVTALWLLPFYPSPLKDDGYDIADYYSINPIYGTLSDFKSLLREAHSRGLRVITELVVNHTSDQHQWFQRSRRAKPGSREREFYVWSDTPEKYKDARIIFRDFEPSNWTWDPVARAYYWHRFYSHQPDLNFGNPQVHAAILRILEFWIEMGVDGFRLDAVPYLYEREGTSCENLPETHRFLKQLRREIDTRYTDRMLLAEANQWPEDAVSYFGSGRGDECHMAFHFPLMPRLFMAVRMEDRFPVVDILNQTPPIPETCQWALFLRNHDELTLEMVTDEERDYMYRVYARDSKARLNLGIRRRLAPLLDNDRRRIELLNMLLFSLPGTPVLYYGDEIGMGDNIFLGDRNGVRTPMQWSADRNAGFSRASPQALYAPIILDPEYHYEAVNVETLQRNQYSLLWWTKRVLALRKGWKVFGHGTLEFLQPENRKVLAFVRQHENETVLVVANLSRFPQPVKLDLARFEKHVPVDLFGRTEFPVISRKPYPLTLSPHAAFWFSLEHTPSRETVHLPARACPTLTVDKTWDELLGLEFRAGLESCLPAYVRACRWFSGTPGIKSAQFREIIPLTDPEKIYFTIVWVEYAQGDPEEYLLPLAFATGKPADQIMAESPHCVLAHVQVKSRSLSGILHDAAAGRDFPAAFLDALARRRALKGNEGSLEPSSSGLLRTVRRAEKLNASGKTDQRNTIILYGDQFVLKLLRRLETGSNPELEVGRFLTSREFPNVPATVGALEYVRQDNARICFGILTRYVPNSKNGWEFTLDALRRYFDRVRTLPEEVRQISTLALSLLQAAEKDTPAAVVEMLGTYFESARLLGRRTAALHLALSSDAENPDFAPEPFTPFYQRSLYQSLRNRLLFHFLGLRRRLKSLPPALAKLAEKVLPLQDAFLRRLRAIHETPLSAQRIRCHGDYHLGQVLHTGKDFMIIDFEGESARPMGERRIKRPPLRDVASMIRSFDYAAQVALTGQFEAGTIHEGQFRDLQPLALFWTHWTSAVFLREYLAVMSSSAVLPKSPGALAVLLDAFLLDKAMAEMTHELDTRPDWVHVPLQGILQLAEAK